MRRSACTARSTACRETQAQAILDLRLHRLTGLEQDKILAEYAELLDVIRDLSDILARPERLLQVIRDELLAIRDQYGDARRTRIERDESDLTIEDLITPQDVVVTLSHGGYAKSQPVSEYRAQGRGGRGRSATAMKDEDFVEKLFVANTHDTLLCFSSRGQLYWLKVYQLPMAGRASRGKPIVNLLPLEEGERITAVLPIREYEEDKYIFMATAIGTVKKTSLVAFSRPRTAGIIAVGLEDGDQLVGVDITDGKRDVMMFTTEGKAIRFAEDDVRPMGRNAAGVRGIRLPEGERVISLIIPDPQGLILIASENGYGKLTSVDEFPVHGRGGQGVIAIQTTERNGQLVAATQVATTNELMLMSSGGTLVRTRAAEVSVLGRNTQGVRLIRLDEGERLIGVESVEPEPESEQRRRRQASGRGRPRARRRPAACRRRLATASCRLLTAVQPALPEICRHDPRVQFQRRPRRAAAGSARATARRDARLARPGHVGDGDEPSRQGVRRHCAAGRSRPARTPGGPGRTTRCCSCRAAPRRSSPRSRSTSRPPERWSTYVNTGAWSKKAIAEAKKYCKVNVVADAAAAQLHARAGPGRVAALGRMPPTCTTRPTRPSAASSSRSSREVDVPLVADFSSTILSRPLDVSRFGVIYAGAQKNIGPAGLVVVIVRDDLLGRARAGRADRVRLEGMAADGSMLNTPATYSWYVAGLVFQWLKRQGGLEAMGRAQPGQGAQAVRRHRCVGLLSQSRGGRQPLVDEHAVHAAERGTRQAVHRGREAGRPGDAGGPPFRRRHARQHLQRHADGRRRCAGAVHERVPAHPRLSHASRS